MQEYEYILCHSGPEKKLGGKEGRKMNILALSQRVAGTFSGTERRILDINEQCQVAGQPGDVAFWILDSLYAN